MSQRAKPALPAPQGGANGGQTKLLSGLREQALVWRGDIGSRRDQVVTFGDLEGTDVGNITYAGGTPTITSRDKQEVIKQQPLSNLAASPLFQSVILTWDGVKQRGYAHTEIWRNTSDDLGTAILRGTAIGGIFDDKGDTGQTYYYWVRAISTTDSQGAFNATDGVSATPGQVGNVDLSDALITANKIAGDAVTTTKIAKAAVGSAAIANLAVTNAAIQDAAIDSVKIANLAVDSAKIADLTVGTEKISPNAVSRTVSAYTRGIINLTTSAQTVQSATINSEGGNLVILFTAQAGGHRDSGSANHYIATGIEYEDSGGTVTNLLPSTKTMLVDFDGTDAIALPVAFVQQTTLASDTYTFRVNMLAEIDDANRNSDALRRSLVIFELKR